MPLWPQGLDEALGDALVTEYPLQTSGDVFYVSSVSGSDSYDGLDRVKPFATLTQAIATADDYDMIVLLADHEETIATMITVAQVGLIIVGAGLSGGNPTVTLTVTDAAGLAITGEGSEVRGLKFINDTAASVCIGYASNPGCLVRGCRFEIGGDGTVGILFEGEPDHFRIDEGTTFVSTATDVTLQPSCGIAMVKGPTGMVMEDVIFDGGAAGFSSGGFQASLAADLTLRGERLSLLNGADMFLHADALGVLNVTPAEGGGRVVWLGS